MKTVNFVTITLWIAISLSSIPLVAQTTNLKKSKVQIYEQEDDIITITSALKAVREIAENTEVLFEDSKFPGIYTLPKSHSQYGLYRSRLLKVFNAGKSGASIQVDENQSIIKVEIAENFDQPAKKIENITAEELQKIMRGK